MNGVRVDIRVRELRNVGGYGEEREQHGHVVMNAKRGNVGGYGEARGQHRHVVMNAKCARVESIITVIIRVSKQPWGA